MDDQSVTHPEGDEPDRVAARPSRRAILAGAGVLSATALAGCATYGNDSTAPAKTPEAGQALAKTTDIPEGGGKIFTEAEVVVTQPTAGEFKAFSAVCTHAGCIVSEISSGTIDCTCHGTKFTLDGAVDSGPAPDPLPTQAITVEGDNIFLG